MRYWYDKEFKGVICEPNSAEEWMELIQDIGWHYDGCNTVESLKGLIDEMVEMASEGQNKVKRMKRTEDSLRDLWDISNTPTLEL